MKILSLILMTFILWFGINPVARAQEGTSSSRFKERSRASGKKNRMPEEMTRDEFNRNYPSPSRRVLNAVKSFLPRMRKRIL